MKRTCTIDIESNGLLSQMINFSSRPYRLKDSARLWVVVITDTETGESFIGRKDEITKEWIENTLKPYSIIVAHNGIKFDFPALKLFGVFDYKIGEYGKEDILFGRPVKFVDTAILSRMSRPDRLGGHSLDAWGRRVGELKTDFRRACVDAGIIKPQDPKGSEFLTYSDIMVDYCIKDTVVNAKVLKALYEEFRGYNTWKNAFQMETKLADRGIRRELLGFKFDKELALKNLEFLNSTMQELASRVNPVLPKKRLGITAIKEFTPPKNQLKSDGELSASMLKFIDKIGAIYLEDSKSFLYKDKVYSVPYQEPLEEFVESTIDDLDVVKSFLIELGWEPTEWRERDLLKDSKKQLLSLEKSLKAKDRWVKETLEGKYKNQRLEFLEATEKNLSEKLERKIRSGKTTIVPTSPLVRVGVDKELCPNLVEMGDKVSFAKDFSDYLTYKHRRSSIAGGDIEDLDFQEDVPETGYLMSYREEDGRIPTPAIELGANTQRYTHIGVANIPTEKSMFGKEMRSMFGVEDGHVQFGFDFSSLEARIEGHFVYHYDGGKEMAVSLIAEKPNDIHTVNATKLGIPRPSAKSVKYAITYGASPNKFIKMLGMSKTEAQEFYNNYWEQNPALKQLKEDKEREWVSSGKKYILGIDGRRINIRSKHSILNALFQSSGVICTKYVTIFLFEELERLGYNVDVLESDIDIGAMIEYHDENQITAKKELFKFKTFNDKEEAYKYVESQTGSQISAVTKGTTKYYITEPNVISEAVQRSISRVEEMFNLNVPLGFEWIVNKNWYGCH